MTKLETAQRKPENGPGQVSSMPKAPLHLDLGTVRAALRAPGQTALQLRARLRLLSQDVRSKDQATPCVFPKFASGLPQALRTSLRHPNSLGRPQDVGRREDTPSNPSSSHGHVPASAWASLRRSSLLLCACWRRSQYAAERKSTRLLVLAMESIWAERNPHVAGLEQGPFS